MRVLNNVIHFIGSYLTVVGLVFAVWGVSKIAIPKLPIAVEIFITINWVGVYFVLISLSIYSFLTKKRFNQNKLYGWVYLLVWALALLTLLYTMIKGYS